MQFDRCIETFNIKVKTNQRIYTLSCWPKQDGEHGFVFEWKLDGRPLPYDPDHFVLDWNWLFIFYPNHEMHQGLFECNGRFFKFEFPDFMKKKENRVRNLVEVINEMVFILLIYLVFVCLLLSLLSVILQRIVSLSVRRLRQLELAMDDREFNEIFDKLMEEPPDNKLEKMIQLSFMALVK